MASVPPINDQSSAATARSELPVIRPLEIDHSSDYRLLQTSANRGERGRTVSCYRRLLQLCVLRFRLLQDGDVRGGVFPEGEEILIGFSGFRRVASEHGAARQPQVGKRVELSPIGVLPSTAPIGALVIQDLFELSRCLSAFMQTQVSQAPQVHRLGISTLVRRGGCQQFHGFGGLIALERDRSANRGELHRIPEGSVWKQLRSLPGQLLRL